MNPSSSTSSYDIDINYLAGNATRLFERRTDSNFSTVIDKNVYYALACFMFTVFVFGILFNGIFIYIFLVDQKLKTRSNILLVSLCVCGFLISALAVPFVGASALATKWLFGHTGCVFHGFIVTSLGLTQIGILTVMSFEKYITIVQSNWYNLKNKSATYLLVFLCALYGFLLGTYPLLGWNKYVEEDAHVSCSINWRGSSPSDLSYSICLLIFGLGIPVSVITFSYSKIIILVKRQRRLNTMIYAQRQRKRMKARDLRMVKTILLLVCAYLVSWLPYSIMAIISIGGHLKHMHPLTTVIPSVFAKSAIIWNPVIYAIRDHKFKKAFAGVCPCISLFLVKLCCRRHCSRKATIEATDMIEFQRANSEVSSQQRSRSVSNEV